MEAVAVAALEVRKEPLIAFANTDDRDTSLLCDDINESEADGEYVRHLPSNLAIAVHRKTGFVFAGHAKRCFNGTGEVERIMAQDMTSVRGYRGLKFMHITRDPYDLAVSEYLYNKVSSTEVGTLRNGTAGHHLKLCRKENPLLADTLPVNDESESLRDYLTRVGEDAGLRLTMCIGKFEMRGMVDASRWCREHTRCRSVRLEDFMKDSQTYMQTWKDVISWAHLHWSVELEACLAQQDLHSPTFINAKHCSSRVVSDLERERIKDRVAALDQTEFQGTYRRVADSVEFASES